MSVVQPAPASTSDDEFFRFSVDQYHEMIRRGILDEDDPVELLEGYLVKKMPITPPHAFVTDATGETLRALVPPGWFVQTQQPITTDTSEPEPDVTVVRGNRRLYRQAQRHPGPQDLALLVEVADATLQRDQGPKKRHYAQVKIPVYWIINLIDRRVEVYTEPSGPAENPDYGRRQDFGMEDEVPVVIEGCEVGRIPVRDLFE
jgi:Uma2 family endonuclease